MARKAKKHLSEEEFTIIRFLLQKGDSVASICKRLERSAHSISLVNKFKSYSDYHAKMAEIDARRTEKAVVTRKKNAVNNETKDDIRLALTALHIAIKELTDVVRSVFSLQLCDASHTDKAEIGKSSS